MLAINTVLERTDNSGTKERVIWIDSRGRVCCTINVFNQSLFGFKEISVLKKEIDAGIWEVCEDPWQRLVTKQQLSDKEVLYQEKAWEVVQALLKGDTLELIGNESRNKKIRTVASSFNLSEKTVINYLKRYWKRGLTKEALLPDYHQSGGKGIKKKVSKKKEDGRECMRERWEEE